MIAFRNFALRRGERLLLSNVDLTLHAGHRVGVVGRNGCGKTSLFAAILREVEPDKGELDMPTRLRVASVAQETPSLPDPALDFVLGGDEAVYQVIRAEAAAMDAEDYDAVAEAHHRLDELNGYDAAARAGRLLHGLGFPRRYPRAAGVGVLRRLARAPEPGARADEAVRPPAARRADQPPRPRCGAVAGAVAAQVSRHAAADLARPRVPRRRVHAHAAPQRRQGQALHRRLHLVRAPARRTPA